MANSPIEKGSFAFAGSRRCFETAVKRFLNHYETLFLSLEKRAVTMAKRETLRQTLHPYFPDLTGIDKPAIVPHSEAQGDSEKDFGGKK
ncbi:hypothetical protein [Marinobacter sp. V034]|uniref:hypothetical protein n=1 Tax=Marinobacter sp. V034 TaxID=3459610 RepID=UPI00404493C4